ncbi:transporter substrate-binding domain-containing protein [Sediminicoccus sp. KRV36]|uniref:substrate-binding periplasmic protein n=1 Tax=Sediminicoccus sp. KRV36 TaxID=3133721 RepID=UPI00200C1EC6|nr:transporter substrate-binding domain-containing protein [Sediminicoccus rosea]UPY36070.1 transporter substrate-binding domain-containing protein [Sediminicoccus rosea]
MRRRALIAPPVLLAAPLVLARPAQARGAIELVTADHRPYAIAEGPEPGFVLTLVAEMFRMIGLQVVFRFLPWPEAEARAASLTGRAIAPLPRTPAREARFRWAVALFDDPSGFASLQQRPPDTLAEAQTLPRIAVLEGSWHEGFLRERGLANLVPMPGWPEALAAMRGHSVSAWFGALPLLRSHLGRVAQLGRPVVAQPAWLALNPATLDIPLVALSEAHAALEADGSLSQMLRPFLGAAA